MANYQTINSIIASVRRRMATTNLNVASDLDIGEFVRDSLASLHEELVSVWQNFYLKTQSIVLTANTESYVLPADFRAEVAVYALGQAPTVGNPRKVQLDPFNWNQFNSLPPTAITWGGLPIMYRIAGNSIYFTPVGGTVPLGAAIELWYTPAFTPPVDNVTTISDVIPNGWDLWVVLDVCATLSVRSRQIDFYQLFSGERQRAQERLLKAARMRSETPKVMINQFDTPGGLWGCY